MKRGSVLPYAVSALALMLVPSGLTQRARLTVLLGFVPVRSLASSAHGLAAQGWEKIRPPRPSEELRRQNEFLRSQVVALHARNGELTSKNESLSAARTLVSDSEFELLPADVVLSLDSSPYRRTLVIGCGTRQGVARGMLVLHHTHILGRVLEAGPWTSRVLLVTDPAFNAGAVSVPRTGEAPLAYSRRDVGVFEGTGGKAGRLKWLAGETPVEEGAYVVTAEHREKGVPKGLLLGRVTGVDRGRGSYAHVEVTPIVDPQGLEFVLVLKPK